MFKKLSFRLAIAIIAVMIVIMFLFTFYLVKDRSRHLEKSIMNKGITNVQTGATIMGKMFDTIIDNGFFTVEEVFNYSLVPIELPDKILEGYKKNPKVDLEHIQKYHYRSGLDSYLDGAILEIQDQFLKDPQVIYAAMLDKNGYLPTHNSRYSKRLTGDYEYDLQHNRTKRVFTDSVAINASNVKDKAYIVQIYKRDTGQVMWDFAAPIFIKGRHWGVFRMGFAMEDTEHALTALKWKLVLLMSILLVILVFVVVQITSIMMRPLSQLSVGVQQVAKGDLTFQQQVKSNDEVGELAKAFNKMVKDLKSYIQNLTETTADKERMESELKIAHDIQIGILPKIFPPFPDCKEIDLHASIEPAKEVGGDLYDFFFLDEDHLCFTIGDVSGKGVPASLMMAVTSTLIRAKAKKDMTPDQILIEANKALCSSNEDLMFVTVFIGILNIKTGVFLYSNGGHNLPFLFREGGKIESLVNTTTLVLGVDPDFNYRFIQTRLNPGDGIYLYTDGVTEAINVDAEEFSVERLTSVLETVTTKSAKDIDMKIKENLKQFIGSEPQFDDITMITLKYFGPHKQEVDNGKTI